jgi:DNA end-binding protein Ku
MARSIWTGTLSAGMLVLPVKLSTVVSDESVELHQVRKSDGSRINYRRFAAADGEEVAYADIAKGYEAPDGRTVVLTDGDFEQAFGGKSRNARILQFTELGSVPRTAAGTSYYIQPGTGGEQAYALIAKALNDLEKAAVVSIAIRQRESLAVLYPDGSGYLVLERLNWAADVKRPDFAAPAVPSDTALALAAAELVNTMTKPFDWSSYTDTSAERLAEVVQAKLETGQSVGTPAPRPEGSPTPAQDLTAVLQASIAQFRTGPKTTARKPRTARKAAA